MIGRLWRWLAYHGGVSRIVLIFVLSHMLVDVLVVHGSV